MVWHFPVGRAGKAIFSLQKVGGTCGARRRLWGTAEPAEGLWGPTETAEWAVGVHAELAENCGVSADWLTLSCSFPENCLFNSVSV